MFKSRWRIVFVLLAVVLVALFSGLFLRGMIISDFERYIEGERPALARSGLLVLAWPLFLSVPALALGFFLARKPAMLVGQSLMPEPDLGKDVPSPGALISSEVFDAKEDEPSILTDDSFDADDEDMHPLAGDPDRITRIVEGLNKLTKAQALGRALRKQHIELAPFLTAIIEKTRLSFPGKNITFSLECPEGLAMSADPDCLTGIVENLMDNAAKAVKNAGTVTVSAEARGDQALFAVRDTGTGIRRKDVPHLFEQYYRASGSGIGLGLTIVKELVDACRGTIEVRSSRGRGSVFILSLPHDGID